MKKDYQIIILGSGPAGLQAAIHAARAKASCLVVGRQHKSSLYRAHVENFCCMGGVSGEDLLEQGRLQAADSGADFLEEDVIELVKTDSGFTMKSESGDEYTCRAIILSMGISRNKLGVPGEKELLGKGVSYCVDCDAGFFRGEPVIIVGGESAAAAGAMTMLFYASEVHLAAQKLAVSERMMSQLEASQIKLHLGRTIKAIAGETEVEGVALDNDEQIPVKGVFIELGAKGAIELAAGLGVSLDPETFRYVAVNKKQETNVAGVYAAGDITGPPWQVAKAVGEGCVAGLEAARYAKKTT